VNLPYLARLVCLCLASLFLVHAVLGLLISALTPWAVKLAHRLQPVHGARLLLAVRLIPATFALFVVAALCTPSYLYLEPKDGAEEMGVACLTAALLGLAICAVSSYRSATAMARSLRHLRDCRMRGREMRLPGERKAAWVIEDSAPCVMLAGVLRPRMVISSGVVSALTAPQLSAVIRHEQAHGISHDNLKRLLVMLAPGMLPFTHGFRDLERAWAQLSEWAADDRAAAGKARRSLSLAAALVRVARLGSVAAAPALATSLISEGAELSQRVDRLLHPTRRTAWGRKSEPVLMASAGLLLAGATIAAVANPATLHAAHECLEFLI
jgi:beta-lactamase regulating signal transducer with metallopeptidase domain